MTRPSRSGGGAVHWLTAQAVMFGAMAALLGIVANAMFLDAFGSGWLPATYIAIGAAGIVVSGAVARSAQRFDLLRLALVVLGAAAVGLALAWVVAAGGDAAWVSVPLLILFPILIQLGFVFIGGQAGRLLDIAGIKASFPRIVAGFPVGAVIGGVLGGPLVTALGRTEHLLLPTALTQAAFAALVLITGRRYAAQLGTPGGGPRPQGRPGEDGRDGTSDRSLRALLASRFVALILAYQVLSAVGSQLADFLVYDRATAQYPDPVDLARYLSAYTAVMNAVSIAFLFLLAGPLLRRFGLRLGIPANPLVLSVFAVAMLAVGAGAGAASIALLATVSAARIADIALTDGTTRTSINATYQVLPERTRLPVQTAVEGVGVPVAIGISGVLILALNALPFALTATIAITALVCAAWTWVGVLLYRAYGPALVHALQRRPLLAPTADLDLSSDDEAAALRLVASSHPRAMRLGLDLLSARASPGMAAELAGLTRDERPEVRLTALAGLAGSGDDVAGRRLAAEVRAGLDHPDVAVRIVALDAVQPGDAFALAPAVAALGDPRSAEAAAGAVARLGDAVVESMAELLGTAGSPAPPIAGRLVRAAATPSEARDEVLRRHLGHSDRELALAVAERLVSVEPASEATAAALDEVLVEDVRHAGLILAASAAIDSAAGDAPATNAPLRRALRDELDLALLKVTVGRLARHGSARLGPVMVELGVVAARNAGGSRDTGGARGALALEALDVLLGPEESKLVVPLLQPDLSTPERLARLAAELPRDAPSDLVAWLRDLVEDPAGRWRSTWLRACAIHAAKDLGVLDQLDLGTARAIGDAIIDETLA